MSNKEQEELKSRVETMVFQSLIQICGNGLYLEGNEDERTNSRDRHNNDYSAWTAELTNVAHTTISFPNKNSTYLDGKPHDIEIRAPLALFHRCVGKKRKRLIHHSVTAVSNFGVARTIHSPVQLASLLCCTLEETLRYENLTNIIRPNASGIICLVTIERAQLLRESGRFPCPQCVKWCKGEKGLWWHQQMDHGQEHAVAAATAASEKNVLALVVYNPNQALSFRNTPCHEQRSRECQDEASIVFEHARNGNLERIKEAIEVCWKRVLCNGHCRVFNNNPNIHFLPHHDRMGLIRIKLLIETVHLSSCGLLVVVICILSTISLNNVSVLRTKNRRESGRFRVELLYTGRHEMVTLMWSSI